MILLELFLTFLKIGAFTFGGGYAMIPIIQSEVLSRNWLSPSALVDFLAVSEGTPGPFSVNVATYVGERTAAIPGAIMATLGLALPSFVIILIISKFFTKIRDHIIMRGLLNGLKSAVVGLIAAAVITVARSVFLPGEAFRPAPVIASAIICALCTFMTFKKLSPLIVIGTAAGCGIICYFIPIVSI